MQWIVGHGPEHLVSRYNIHRVLSIVDSQWDVELISKFNSKEANTLMGPNGPRSKLIFFDDMIYEGWMGFQFTFMYKGVLVIMQGCTRISEWYL